MIASDEWWKDHTMKRIACYARCSTVEQSLDVQIGALREYASRCGAVGVEYLDHGVSGAKDRRPALDRLLEDARRRAFDVLAVVRLDRLFRSVRHLTAVAAELEALGVDLVVLDQAIDSSTPSGRLLFNVLGSIAEFERDLLHERVTSGIQAAKRKGIRFGRPAAMTREMSERARRLRGSGHSTRAIAKLLGVGVGTVHRALVNGRAPRSKTLPVAVPVADA
jgi:DNA invertase Pin-like site-specific DNA recombinase